MVKFCPSTYGGGTPENLEYGHTMMLGNSEINEMLYKDFSGPKLST